MSAAGDQQGEADQGQHRPRERRRAPAIEQHATDHAAAGDGAVPGHHVERQGDIRAVAGGISFLQGVSILARDETPREVIEAAIDRVMQVWDVTCG